MDNLVEYTTERGVAIITLNDPPVNAYTHDMLTELDACIAEARFDEDIHVVVVTGHGDHYFSAGANIKMLREVDGAFRYNLTQSASETFRRIETTPKLTIAALNGHAMGGGFDLALCCDLRIAWAGEGTLGFPEVTLGLMPATGGVKRLAQHIGKGRAMQIILEAQRLAFDDALEQGLLNYVWEAETSSDFLRRVIEYAHGMCLPKKATRAVCKVKQALQMADDLPMEQAIVLSRELQSPLLSSADVQEGLDAWLSKRTAHFSGR